jgi:CRISPR-associated protein Csm1
MTATEPFDVAYQVLQAWTTAATGEQVTAPPALTAAAWQLCGQSPQSTWPSLPDALDTIFTRLRTGSSQQRQQWQKPAMLRCDEDTLFPQDKPVKPDNALADNLRQVLQAVGQINDPEQRVERLLFGLQWYAWSLPSPLPAVSLYDLARLHAAVAAAQTADPEHRIALVGGDLSGLQEFLYSIPAEGAARQLRGRSFYLQLLTDACANYVLRESGMPLCNLLYAGGGRFYVVVPGHVVDQVLGWRKHLGRILLKAHHGLLYLALGTTQPFAPDTYSDTTWIELTQAIDRDKRRRFAALDPDEFAQMFQPRMPRPPRGDDEQTDDRLGESLAELGRQLTRAVLLQVGTATEPLAGETWRAVTTQLGWQYEFLPQPPVRAGRFRILALDDEAAPHSPAQAMLVGPRYTVTEAYRLREDDLHEKLDEELRPGDVAPFTVLARRSRGVARIAVLRMDVDNLGDLFGKGLERPAGLAGLAVTAALSSALSRFFEGWVGELCRRMNQTEGGIYAVYSGGDDLFLVGSWHVMPELARTIRNDFVRYTTGIIPDGIPPVSVSAGITLHQAGYPLYQAAEDAGNALDAAKSYTRPDGRNKDAITFLGQTLSWQEFAEASRLKDELVTLIEQGAPRSLLITLQRLSLYARPRYNRDGVEQLTVGPWVWQGVYQFTRLAERSSDEVKQKIVDLRERLLSSEGIMARTIIPAGLAARWAQLLLRSRDRNR